jgi:hypothetical protein
MLYYCLLPYRWVICHVVKLPKDVYLVIGVRRSASRLQRAKFPVDSPDKQSCAVVGTRCRDELPRSSRGEAVRDNRQAYVLEVNGVSANAGSILMGWMRAPLSPQRRPLASGTTQGYLSSAFSCPGSYFAHLCVSSASANDERARTWRHTRSCMQTPVVGRTCKGRVRG